MNIEKGLDNPILRQTAQEINCFDTCLFETIANMKQILRETKGAGLAAPQIGQSLRLIIVQDYQNKNPSSIKDKSILTILTLINPEIIAHSVELELGEEGCLSLPNVWADIPRYQWVTIKYDNTNSIPQTTTFYNYTARIMQHEIDHLNGILFPDRIKQ